MLLHVCTFTAAGDDGQEVTILAYENRASVPVAAAPESMTLRTIDGEEVKRLDKGRYKVLKTGLNLTSGSANAP
jgi:hypothetical protein